MYLRPTAPPASAGISIVVLPAATVSSRTRRLHPDLELGRFRKNRRRSSLWGRGCCCGRDVSAPKQLHRVPEDGYWEYVEGFTNPYSQSSGGDTPCQLADCSHRCTQLVADPAATIPCGGTHDTWSRMRNG